MKIVDGDNNDDDDDDERLGFGNDLMMLWVLMMNLMISKITVRSAITAISQKNTDRLCIAFVI